MSATKKEDNKEDSSKVFVDVAKPGETKADPTARPVIVGRSTMIKQDPMMTDGKDDAVINEAENAQPLSSKKITIQPLSPSETAAEEKPKEDSEVSDNKSDESSDDAPKKVTESAKTEVKTDPPIEADNKPDEEKPAETTKTEEAKDEQKEESKADTPGTGAVDALAGEATAKHESEKEADEATKKAAELESSIDNREYFVPIKETMSRRSGRFLSVLILLCLLAAVGLNFAVDAELIDLGIEPLTDLL